jgi:hypothetical protein
MLYHPRMAAEDTEQPSPPKVALQMGETPEMLERLGFTIGGVVFEWHDEDGYRLLDGRNLVPRRFTAKIDRIGAELGGSDFGEIAKAEALGEGPYPIGGLHVELAVEVEDDQGTARCRELTVRPHDEDESITKETLAKLPVADLVRYTVASLATPLKAGPDGTLVQDFSQHHANEDLYKRFARGGRRPRSGSPLTDENLREVATLYRAALENNDPPTLAVAAAKNVSRSTAARWVSEARKRGFLGPALGPRPGEGS